MEDNNIHIVKLSTMNFKNILKKLKLVDYTSLFIEDGYILLEQNTNIDELYQHIYDELKDDEDSPHHKNVDKFFLEIEREVKYVNLYQLDTTYEQKLKLDTLYKLYEDMTNNTLSNIIFNPKNTFLQSINNKYIKLLNDLEAIEDKHKFLMKDELSNFYNNDVETYEEQLTSDYIGVIYGAERNGVTMDEVLNMRFREDKKIYTDSYLYENHHHEMSLMEKYLQNSKKITPEIESELENEIPTTKLVEGKRKRLTKAQREQKLKAKRKEYINDLQLQQSSDRLNKFQTDSKILNQNIQSVHDILDLQIDTSKIISDFYKLSNNLDTNEWDYFIENHTDSNRYRKLNVINSTKKAFKSTATAIKKEKSDINDTNLEQKALKNGEKTLMNL